MDDPERDRPRVAEMIPNRRFVLIALTVVCASVMTVTVFGVAQTLMLEARARDIVDDMLTSIRLIGQLDDYVEEKHLLVDDHILATLPAEMARIEVRLTAIDAEIAATLRAYEPWVNQPGERATSEQTRVDLLTLKDPIDRALALSRQNRNDEARHEMELVSGQFALLKHDFDRLVAINDQGATASLSRFSSTRFRLMLALLAIGLASLAGTAVAGAWASHQVARREEALSLNARMLELRNRELDAFASRVAHDIRGPLTTISLATSHLAATAPQEARTTEILRRGAKRMEALVDDLLTLARIESQVRGRCDPRRVAALVEEDVGARLSSEGGTLRASVEEAEIACSEGLLRQALTNLVENAVKYRRPEVPPEVGISGTKIDGEYQLRVSDNGAGMSTEEAARIFEPLYRSPRMQHLPGTGLGLSIVNRIVQATGGAISVESRLEEGSTFIVHLKLANQATG
jgi:two-component system, OmpR family, sensor kinase